jgi:hypothetical protein
MRKIIHRLAEWVCVRQFRCLHIKGFRQRPVPNWMFVFASKVEFATRRRASNMCKCGCGDPICKNYHISNANSIGGFSREDAQLIIAAPDMLVVLKRLDASWSKDLPEGPDTPERNGVRIYPEHAAIWRSVRAAIAQAEGKS